MRRATTGRATRGRAPSQWRTVDLAHLAGLPFALLTRGVRPELIEVLGPSLDAQGGELVVAAQFARTRSSAAGTAGVVVGALFLHNGMGRSAPSLGVLRPLSPFFHYEKTWAITPWGLLRRFCDGAARPRERRPRAGGFAWPRSITRPSAFELYGAPLAREYSAFGIVAMAAVTLAARAIERRDLGR